MCLIHCAFIAAVGLWIWANHYPEECFPKPTMVASSVITNRVALLGNIAFGKRTPGWESSYANCAMDKNEYGF